MVSSTQQKGQSHAYLFRPLVCPRILRRQKFYCAGQRLHLGAPFDGHIAERLVEPFYEVKRGQRLFDIYMEGAMEAAISIPESEIHGIQLGLQADISFPIIQGKIFEGIITEISKVAGTANAFPVKVTIEGDLEKIRPGLTAEVTIRLAGEAADTSYLIPLIAFVAGDAAARGGWLRPRRAPSPGSRR